MILSNDIELAELNEEHMGHEGPTDVLSFPLLPIEAFPDHEGKQVAESSIDRPPFALPPGRRTHLGDIVLSVQRARAQAPESVPDEVRQLVVHGALHICGWDHADPVENAGMRALERKILAAE